MDKKYKKALNLEYLTVGYSIIEAVLAIFAGITSGSIALVAWGLDSIAELMSGFVLIWRIRKQSEINSEEQEKRIENKAIKLVGISFLLLAGYVIYETAKMIITVSPPDPSLLGIILAIVSLIIMPIISYQKYNIGKNLSLKSLIADSKETLVCSLLSFALLIGLLANYMAGFWQMDPIISSLIVIYLIKEGTELLSNKTGH